MAIFSIMIALTGRAATSKSVAMFKPAFAWYILGAVSNGCFFATLGVLHVLVNTSRKRPHLVVPVRFDGNAGEGSAYDRDDTAGQAKCHRSIYGDPHLSVSEDASVLP